MRALSLIGKIQVINRLIAYDYDYLFDIVPSFTRSFGGTSHLHVLLYT